MSILHEPWTQSLVQTKVKNVKLESSEKRTLSMGLAWCRFKWRIEQQHIWPKKITLAKDRTGMADTSDAVRLGINLKKNVSYATRIETTFAAENVWPSVGIFLMLDERKINTKEYSDVGEKPGVWFKTSPPSKRSFLNTS